METIDKKIKVVFIGTPEFGVPSLSHMIKDERFDVQLVIAQPDKKIGRKQILTPPPIKLAAQENNIRVLQPEKITEVIPELRQITPDIIIVIAYAQIIPKELLEIPKYGCINVHGSLLPNYRGASCIQAAILNGSVITGLTIMKMDENLDTGPILAQKEITIEPDDTSGTIYKKLSLLAPEFLIDTIVKYIKKEIEPVEQSGISTYAKKLTKESGRIDWHKDATYIERFIRAMTPWPSAYTTVDGKLLKILEVENSPLPVSYGKPGMVMSIVNKIFVQTGTGAIALKRVQLEGKKEMNINEFIKGFEIVNKILK